MANIIAPPHPDPFGELAATSAPALITLDAAQQKQAFDFAVQFGQLDNLLDGLNSIEVYLTEKITQMENLALQGIKFDQERLARLQAKQAQVTETRDLTNQAIQTFDVVKTAAIKLEQKINADETSSI